MVTITFLSALAATLATTVSATPVDMERRATSTTTGVVYPTLSSEQIETLKKDLYVAPSESERQLILFQNGADASNITYQFHNNSVKAPTGGTIALSGVDQFPALIGTNVGMAIGFVNPCGLNTPHLHPRANEFLTVVQGQLVGGLILEQNPGSAGNLDGKDPTGPIQQVNATLSNYRGMLFPQGQVHFQFNPTCEPAVFAAAFDNLDPGRTQIARNFFSVLPDEAIIAAAGGDTELLDATRIDKLRNIIPAAFAEQMEGCAKRCGLPTNA
ncbi:Spherulin-1A [Paramyrothecium foliicola]|nr:Spherulin-1A [Paramyrothecium foliicola]